MVDIDSVIDTLLECRVSELSHQHFVLLGGTPFLLVSTLALAFPNPLALLGGLAVLWATRLRGICF